MASTLKLEVEQVARAVVPTPAERAVVAAVAAAAALDVEAAEAAVVAAEVAAVAAALAAAAVAVVAAADVDAGDVVAAAEEWAAVEDAAQATRTWTLRQAWTPRCGSSTACYRLKERDVAKMTKARAGMEMARRPLLPH